MAFPHHSSTLLPASGFHPTLKTTIRHLRPLGAGMSSTTRDDASDVQQDSELNNHYTSSCSLHLLYTFSSSVILDQYQLAQLHDEGRLVKSRRSIITDDGSSGSSQGKDSASPVQSELFLGGQLDLEAPVERIRPDEGALAFLSIPMASGATRRSSDQAPSPDSPSVDVVVEMPLHLRYQEPVASRWLSAQGWSGFGGHWWNKHPMPEGWQDIVEVNVDWPCVFWACDKEQPDIVGSELYATRQSSTERNQPLRLILLSFLLQTHRHRTASWMRRTPVLIKFPWSSGERSLSPHP